MAKKKSHQKVKLSVEEKKRRKEQRDQIQTISTTLRNIGFIHIPGVDGKTFEYKGRTTEMDDIFVYRNLVLLVEYTIEKNPSTHFLKKNYFYQRVNESNADFFDFLITSDKFPKFKEHYDAHMSREYSSQEVIFKILYCSKNDLEAEHIQLVNPVSNNENVIIYDKNISRYFSLTAKGIKRTAIYEFLEFIDVPLHKVNIETRDSETTYDGFLMPENRSRFSSGFKVLTFYVDAATLLRRSTVFRQNSWRESSDGLSYQRMIDSNKVGRIREYLYNEQRVFVNNIIGSVSVDNISVLHNDTLLVFDNNGNVTNESITDVCPVRIKLKDKCNIIRLIDGQHRTYSYYEGNDKYEEEISRQRKKQDLLLTIVVFPKSITETERVRFEAKLFQEINTKQTSVKSSLTQEIACLLDPFSTVAMAKIVLQRLARKNKALVNRVMLSSLDTDTSLLKTSSIVSYGLAPLLKVDDLKTDSLYVLWDHPNKKSFIKDSDFGALEGYVDFCVDKIDELLSAVKMNLDGERWSVYSKNNPNGFLTVTSVNGCLNLLRILIEKNQANGREYYSSALTDIRYFDVKSYKSSQYRTMGIQLYKDFFADMRA